MLAFAVICVGCIAATAASLLVAIHRSAVPANTGASGAGGPAPAGPRLMFRTTAAGDAYGHLAVVPLGQPNASPAVEPLACDRVAYAADRGVCLTTDPGVLTTYRATVFDASYRSLFTRELVGIPSRTQVSPDGRLASVTVFVAGDSYAAAGFSTRTAILDLRTGNWVAYLEHFAVTKDGARFQAIDFNFWGVTFAADSDTFYATLATQGTTYLVKGRVSTQQMTVLREGVECPSLSPDGTRIGFKKRVLDQSGPIMWTISVLDLATLRDHPLSESRNVDDQVAWLDNGHILYGLPHAQSGFGSSSTDAWVVAADGSGAPRIYIANAWSPAVVPAG
jgi:hypothetical protein